jgi:hypothetical protein
LTFLKLQKKMKKMINRTNDFASSLLEYHNYFASPQPADWTAEQKDWTKQWANYIASGGERPPKAPPHAVV